MMQKKPYRPFKITCGLREGYDLGSSVHAITDARIILQKWLEERTTEDKKVLVGTLIEGQFVYPWVEGGEVSSRHEPAFYYMGIVREDASDQEALEMLESLAKEFARTLKQKRVHAEFCSTYFLIESA